MREDIETNIKIDVSAGRMLKEIMGNKGKSIIPNEERIKSGLAPIPDGDVAITRISDSSQGQMASRLGIFWNRREMREMGIEKKISDIN